MQAYITSLVFNLHVYIAVKEASLYAFSKRKMYVHLFNGSAHIALEDAKKVAGYMHLYILILACQHIKIYSVE
jgi:hypothetical protein